MSKPINEIGNIYGHLQVIKRAEPKRDINGKSIVEWICRCDCGKEISVRGTSLRSGHTTSCGCHRDKAIKQEVGNRYGKLTVIEYKGIKNQYAQWLCQCDCGNTTIVAGKDLRTGNTRSCGCVKSFREIEINELLLNNNINFQREFSFEDLKYKEPLRFDFAILSDNQIKGLIEYNGEQHYLKYPMGQYTNQRLKEIKTREILKKEYCKNNNIPLLILNKNNYNEDMILKWIEQIK